MEKTKEELEKRLAELKGEIAAAESELEKANDEQAGIVLKAIETGENDVKGFAALSGRIGLFASLLVELQKRERAARLAVSLFVVDDLTERHLAAIRAATEKRQERERAQGDLTEAIRNPDPDYDKQNRRISNLKIILEDDRAAALEAQRLADSLLVELDNTKHEHNILAAEFGAALVYERPDSAKIGSILRSKANG